MIILELNFKRALDVKTSLVLILFNYELNIDWG